MFGNSTRNDGSTPNGGANGGSACNGSGASAAHAPELTAEERLARAELVRDKTGVTFEEARAALEACGYDALDAVVLLERQGKTARKTASYTTASDASAAQAQSEMSQAQSDYEASTKPSAFSATLSRFLDWVKRVLRRSVEISFVVSQRGKRLFSVPLLLFIVLLVLAFWVVLPLIVIGLFFEFRYSFDGIGAVTVDVNDWARRASDGVDSLKRDVMDGHEAGRRDGSSGQAGAPDGRGDAGGQGSARG